MKKDLPFKSVKVGYKTYKFVVWTFDKTLETGCYGECSHAMGEIRYTPVPDITELRNTLLHEVLHACYHVYNIQDEREEGIVTKFTNSLQQVMQDNPKFFNWLTKE